MKQFVPGLAQTQESTRVPMHDIPIPLVRHDGLGHTRHVLGLVGHKKAALCIFPVAVHVAEPLDDRVVDLAVECHVVEQVLGLLSAVDQNHAPESQDRNDPHTYTPGADDTQLIVVRPVGELLHREKLHADEWALGINEHALALGPPRTFPFPLDRLPHVALLVHKA